VNEINGSRRVQSGLTQTLIALFGKGLLRYWFVVLFPSRLFYGLDYYQGYIEILVLNMRFFPTMEWCAARYVASREIA